MRRRCSYGRAFCLAPRGGKPVGNTSMGKGTHAPAIIGAKRRRCGWPPRPSSTQLGPPSERRSASADFRPELGDLLRASVRDTELGLCRDVRRGGHLDLRTHTKILSALWYL